MFEFKRKPTLSPDTFTFGDGENKKIARVNKLTPAKFRRLNEATGAVPLIILHAINAPRGDEFLPYMIEVVNELLDEVCKIVGVLSDVDADWLAENAGVNEIIDYLIATAKKNDFGNVVKNVQSLLTQQ